MLHDMEYLRRDLILNLINHYGPISRTELIALTDYRPATVGDLIKELLDEHQIVETGAVSGGHGRRRILLEINRDYLCAVGIAFMSREVVCIVSGIDGSILLRDCVPILQGESKKLLADRITQKIQEIFLRFHDRKVVGIGICNPLHDPVSYHIRGSLQMNYQHFSDWILENLIPSLTAATQVPVEAYSAVTLPAMAEQRFGVAKGKQNFICVELSNGIGSSIFCNGATVGGYGGVAGELGHTVISYPAATTQPCYCGKPGCVEGSTAYPALASKLRAALESGVFSLLSSYHDDPTDFTVADIRRAIEEGDRLCKTCVRQIARPLGVAIANAVTLLNPELVVLHGFMVELGDYFLEELSRAIHENVLVLSDTFDIKVSAATDVTLPLGAAAEMFSSYLKMDRYQWIYQRER